MNHGERARGAFAIIDDDPGRRQTLLREFAREHYVAPIETLAELRKRWPEDGALLVHDDGTALDRCFAAMRADARFLPVIAYAAEPEVERVTRAMLAGAVGYLDWPSTQSASVAQAALFIDQSRGQVERRDAQRRNLRLVETLSERESEVLSAMAEGHTSKMIARTLDLSPRTVEMHRMRMFEKLNVTRSLQAVRMAFDAREAQARDAAGLPGAPDPPFDPGGDGGDGGAVAAK